MDGVYNYSVGNVQKVRFKRQNIVGLEDQDKAGPLYFLDGRPIKKDEMEKIDPSKIESVNVLKGEQAIKQFGNQAQQGVILIKLKVNK